VLGFDSGLPPHREAGHRRLHRAERRDSGLDRRGALFCQLRQRRCSTDISLVVSEDSRPLPLPAEPTIGWAVEVVMRITAEKK